MAPAPSARRRGLSPLTWLVRGLVLLLLGAALWKLTVLGWQGVQHWLFTRPPVVEGRTAGPAAPVPDAALQRALDGALAGASGEVGAYVWDLGSGASAATREAEPFEAASLFKVPVLVEVLKQERLGRLAPDQQLTVKPEHWADGAGVLQAQVGKRFSVAELTEAMIVQSDNIAARVLMDAVGVDSVNATMLALGLTDTRLAPLAADRGDGRSLHRTSARDMAQLLALIGSGGLVDAPTSEQALRLLERKQANAWLATGLPWWAKLAHKWGELPDARHDAGIVYTPRSRYVVVVLTHGMPPAAAADVIAGVSRAAFDQLGADR